MVFIDGVKYACQRCIRGHRVTSCTHSDQPLVMIKPKGRPASQCSHCREARKKRSLHVKCLCGTGNSKGPKLHRSDCPCAVDSEKCTCTSIKNRPNATGHIVKNTRNDIRHSDVNGVMAHASAVPTELWAASHHHSLDNFNRSGTLSSSSIRSIPSSLSSVTDDASPLSPTNGQLDISLESATSTFVPFDTLAGRMSSKNDLPVTLPTTGPSGLTGMDYTGFGSTTAFPVTFHTTQDINSHPMMTTATTTEDPIINSWSMTGPKQSNMNMNDLESWTARNSLEIW